MIPDKKDEMTPPTPSEDSPSSKTEESLQAEKVNIAEETTPTEETESIPASEKTEEKEQERGEKELELSRRKDYYIKKLCQKRR